MGVATGVAALGAIGAGIAVGIGSLRVRTFPIPKHYVAIVKHFIAKSNVSNLNDRSVNFLTAGYGNTTSAINAVDFKMSSGNIDAGSISLYGVK